MDTDAQARFADISKRLVRHRDRYQGTADLSLDRAGRIVQCLMSVLFPQFTGSEDCAADIDTRLSDLQKDLAALACLLGLENVQADKVSTDFILQLPDIASACHEDAEALLKLDPAAESIEEIILCYPGFLGAAVYRMAHALLNLGMPLLPRLMTEYAHQRTGIDIHPAAIIGRALAIDHGTGVVVGETAVIGDDVKIYQGVTLGALSVKKGARKQKRHPTIGNNVVIYASAIILGGDTVVGDNSVIGGNVWITSSVPANSRVTYNGCDIEQIIPIRQRKRP